MPGDSGARPCGLSLWQSSWHKQRSIRRRRGSDLLAGRAPLFSDAKYGIVGLLGKRGKQLAKSEGGAAPCGLGFFETCGLPSPGRGGPWGALLGGAGTPMVGFLSKMARYCQGAARRHVSQSLLMGVFPGFLAEKGCGRDRDTEDLRLYRLYQGR